MSQAIKVNPNFSEWSSDNEGKDKISIQFIAGTETKKYLEDSETKIDIKWSMRQELEQNSPLNEIPNKGRRLQSEPYEQVQHFYVEVTLTQPEQISLVSADYLKIEALPELLSHDDRYTLDNSGQSDCGDEKNECNPNFTLKLSQSKNRKQQDLIGAVKAATSNTL